MGRGGDAEQSWGTITMNPDWLLEHFDQISEAPDAVPRLRRFILDLAVRGKLVEQDPKDEPASELLRCIKAEETSVASEGKRKSQKSPPSIEAGEMAVQIPASWVLAKVGELLNIQYGKSLPGDDRSDQGSVPVYGSNGIVGYCEIPLAQEPAIIIGRKGSAGALNLCDGPSWTTDVAYFLIPPTFFTIRFLFVALQTLDLESLGKGVKPGLNRSEAYQRPIVVPPLSEQHRIVAKVEELMVLCDELDAAQAKREMRRDRLVAATLHGLGRDVSPKCPLGRDDLGRDGSPSRPLHPVDLKRLQSDGDGALGESALPGETALPIFFNHLPRLTTRPEHIQQLRQTILNLAIRGKLVPQDPNDEPVPELLKRITQEQYTLIENGRLRNQMTLNNLAACDWHYAIPKEWRWVRLADLITSGPQNGVSRKPTDDKKAPKALTLTATTSGRFNPAHFKYIELLEADCKNYWLASGDVLFQRGNTRGYVGIAAVFDGPEQSFVFPDLMIRVRFSKSLALRYIHTALISPPLRIYFSTQATGASSSMPKISQGVLLNAPIPIPPLAEQQRIVAKVDELMALCDELEIRITATATTRRQLLESTLAEALSGQRDLQQEQLHAG
jgi:type I restriction enzyme S subunit